MSAQAPNLLVSVRDAAEALDALAGGAHWIDLKEPRRGALGPVDAATASAVVDVVAGRAPLSAAAGELRDWPGSGADLLDVEGISLVKLGLAGCARSHAWVDAWRQAHTRIVRAGKLMAAVIYADHAAAEAPPAENVLTTAARLGCPWVLWDTFDKSGEPLAAHVRPAELAAQLTAARRCGMKVVVAGRLDRTNISILPRGLIDMVAVRGAVCSESRDSTVSRKRVADLRDVLAATERCVHPPGSISSDNHRVAAR